MLFLLLSSSLLCSPTSLIPSSHVLFHTHFNFTLQPHFSFTFIFPLIFILLSLIPLPCYLATFPLSLSIPSFIFFLLYPLLSSALSIHLPLLFSSISLLSYLFSFIPLYLIFSPIGFYRNISTPFPPLSLLSLPFR